MLPDNTNAFTIILNVNDREFVDLCAISEDGQTRLVTLECGYRKGTVESCTSLQPHDLEINVRITSSNARPTERRVRLHNRMDHFPNLPGRIVEFVG
jgi:hypothetical protein